MEMLTLLGRQGMDFPSEDKGVGGALLSEPVLGLLPADVEHFLGRISMPAL